MTKNNPVVIQSTQTVAKGTQEIQKVVATEISNNKDSNGLEELFAEGTEIGSRPDIRDDNESSETPSS